MGGSKAICSAPCAEHRKNLSEAKYTMSAGTDTRNTYLFESMPVPKAVATMALPTILGQLIVLIYNMADTFFIGRTNDPYMVAAASLILPVFNITLSVAGITGTGGSTLLSRLLGEKRQEEAQKVSAFSITVSFILGLAFSLAMLLFMNPLLRLLGADENTFQFAKQYALWVVVLGGIPTVMSNVLSQFVRSVGESGKAGFGITLGGLVNIALDPLFMFVLLPKGNEILGAGIATCLSNCISCVFFIIVILGLGKDSPVRFVMTTGRPTKKSRSDIFLVGVPSAIATLLFDADYMIIDRLMASYSGVALAAVGIVLKAERLPLNVGVGICQGMMPIVAYNFASKDRKRMRSVSKFALLCGLGFAALSILLYQLFAPYIMRFFIEDAGTVVLGTSFLRVRCLATILMFTSFFHSMTFSSYGEGMYSLFLSVMRWAAFNIPMLFILEHFFGMLGIVWAQFCGDVLTVILSVITHERYLARLWKRDALEAETNSRSRTEKE